MTETDREYYSRRRTECLSRAASARDPGIARIHREFAERYEKALEPAGNIVAR